MLDKKVLANFGVYYSKSRSTDDKILLILTYMERRIGVVGASRIPAEAHPCIGDKIYFGIDLWEMINPKTGSLLCYDHKRFDPGLEVQTVVLGGLGDMFCKVLQRESVIRGGDLVYNIFTHEPPPEGVLTTQRKIWNQLVDSGKAEMVDPEIPLIVMVQ